MALSGDKILKKTLFICVISLFVVGCVQTRQQALQKEKDNTELSQQINFLSDKVEALDKSIVNLVAKLEKNPPAVEKVGGGMVTETVEDRKEILPPPVDPLEVDILEEREIKEEETFNKIERGKPESKTEVPSIEALYNKAFSLYKKKDYGQAIMEFDSLLAYYPDTESSDNALYWKGECYYSMAKFTTAIAKFKEVVKQYPDGNKAADAQLKVGYSYIELKDKKKAGNAFQKVLDLFPFSDAAKVAANKLNTL